MAVFEVVVKYLWYSDKQEAAGVNIVVKGRTGVAVVRVGVAVSEAIVGEEERSDDESWRMP